MSGLLGLDGGHWTHLNVDVATFAEFCTATCEEARALVIADTAADLLERGDEDRVILAEDLASDSQSGSLQSGKDAVSPS